MEIEKKYCYEYPRPSMTADCVIFGFDGQNLKILLIERGIEPYKGYWALPGGFMKMDETIEECATRELREETGISQVYLEQFRVFSSINRDPRGRVVTVAFMALVRPSDYRLVAADDAAKAYWFDAKMLPPLAFDHREIVAAAREHLRESIRLRPVAFRLLNEVFTLEDLRRVYEEINDTIYDRRNFQRKAIQTEMIEAVDQKRESHAFEGMKPSAESSECDVPCEPARRGKPARHFSFRKHQNRNNDEPMEGSIKDIFNW